MKSQTAVTEYMVLVFVIVIISFITVIMVFGFGVMDACSAKALNRERTAMFLLNTFSSSPSLTNPSYQKGFVFDDSKLTVASCRELEMLFGEGWHAEVMVIKDRAGCDELPVWRRGMCLRSTYETERVLCTQNNYPECSRWVFCEKKEDMVYSSVPVNVYRKINGTVELGVLTLGVSSGV